MQIHVEINNMLQTLRFGATLAFMAFIAVGWALTFAAFIAVLAFMAFIGVSAFMAFIAFFSLAFTALSEGGLGCSTMLR